MEFLSESNLSMLKQILIEEKLIKNSIISNNQALQSKAFEFWNNNKNSIDEELNILKLNKLFISEIIEENNLNNSNNSIKHNNNNFTNKLKILQDDFKLYDTVKPLSPVFKDNIESNPSQSFEEEIKKAIKEREYEIQIDKNNLTFNHKIKDGSENSSVTSSDVNENFSYVDDSIVNRVIQKFINRSVVGKEKYGKTLDREDLNFNDWITHAQEELMDGILYLEKLKQYKN